MSTGINNAANSTTCIKHVCKPPLVLSSPTQNRLNRNQKQQVQQFKQVTGAPDDLSIDLLRRSGWSLDAAVDGFYASGFASGMRSQPSVDAAAVEQLYARYQGMEIT